MKNPFIESNGVFSWRKTGTALFYVLFAYLVIGFAIVHKFSEIPGSYMALFYMVIAFYFVKEPLKNIAITKKKSDDVQPNPNDPNPR